MMAESWWVDDWERGMSEDVQEPKAPHAWLWEDQLGDHHSWSAGDQTEAQIEMILEEKVTAVLF